MQAYLDHASLSLTIFWVCLCKDSISLSFMHSCFSRFLSFSCNLWTWPALHWLLASPKSSYWWLPASLISAWFATLLLNLKLGGFLSRIDAFELISSGVRYTGILFHARVVNVRQGVFKRLEFWFVYPRGNRIFLDSYQSIWVISSVTLRNCLMADSAHFGSVFLTKYGKSLFPLNLKISVISNAYGLISNHKVIPILLMLL